MQILTAPPNKKKYRKWAKGTGSAVGQASYPYAKLTVTGLTFKPTTVIISYKESANQYVYFRANSSEGYIHSEVNNNVFGNLRNISGSTYALDANTDGQTQFNANGFEFTIASITNGSLPDIKWIAFQ